MDAQVLRVLEDEYRIRSLITDFALLADECPDVQQIAALFEADASWVMGSTIWRGSAI